MSQIWYGNSSALSRGRYVADFVSYQAQDPGQCRTVFDARLLLRNSTSSTVLGTYGVSDLGILSRAIHFHAYPDGVHLIQKKSISHSITREEISSWTSWRRVVTITLESSISYPLESREHLKQGNGQTRPG